MPNHFTVVAQELNLSARGCHDARDAARVGQAWNALLAIEQEFGARTDHINEQNEMVEKLTKEVEGLNHAAKKEEGHKEEGGAKEDDKEENRTP